MEQINEYRRNSGLTPAARQYHGGERREVLVIQEFWWVVWLVSGSLSFVLVLIIERNVE
jgi:hypothetical protein